jgi:hypothetical protein
MSAIRRKKEPHQTKFWGKFWGLIFSSLWCIIINVLPQGKNGLKRVDTSLSHFYFPLCPISYLCLFHSILVSDKKGTPSQGEDERTIGQRGAYHR